MEPFIEKDNKVLVDCYAVELYLPAEYAELQYRGAPYYAVLGTKVKYLGIGNFRFFKTEAEMENPDNVKCYPYMVPMLLTCQPTDIDIREVRFIKGGRVRKCIVLTFIKGDEFLCNMDVIKSGDPVMMYMARLEGGKLDNVPPEVVVEGLHDAEVYSGISLRIPSEDMEIFVSMRYKDPDHPNREYRYYTGDDIGDRTVARNARTDAQQQSTFSGFMFEDINNSLIVANNRAKRGVVDEVTPFEAIIRGLPLDQWKDADAPPLQESPLPTPVVEEDSGETPRMVPVNDGNM